MSVLDVLVIEPGHGSVWLMDSHYVGDKVTGWAWDDSGRGSAFMPDDYRGEKVILTYPRRFILKIEEKP